MSIPFYAFDTSLCSLKMRLLEGDFPPGPSYLARLMNSRAKRPPGWHREPSGMQKGHGQRT